MDGSSSSWPPAGADGTARVSPAAAGGHDDGRYGGPGHVRDGDPVDGSTEPGPPTAAVARRRWPWVVAVVLLVAVAGAAGAMAWDQRETAAAWRDRAEALEDQRDDALGRGEALQGQLDHLADLLATSETDVADLEERIRELADEKAQAQDTATTVQVERDVLADVSTQIASAVDALDACVTRLFDLHESSVEAFNRAAAGEPVDVGPLNEQATSTTDFCNEARSAAADAAAAAERIPG